MIGGRVGSRSWVPAAVGRAVSWTSVVLVSGRECTWAFGTGCTGCGAGRSRPVSLSRRLGAGHVRAVPGAAWRAGSGVDHRAVHGAVLHADRRNSGCAGGRRVRVRAVDAGRLDGRPASCGNRSDGRRGHLDRRGGTPASPRRPVEPCCTAWPGRRRGGWGDGVGGIVFLLTGRGTRRLDDLLHARGRLMSVPVGLPAGLALGFVIEARRRWRSPHAR